MPRIYTTLGDVTADLRRVMVDEPRDSENFLRGSSFVTNTPTERVVLRGQPTSYITSQLAGADVDQFSSPAEATLFADRSYNVADLRAVPVVDADGNSMSWEVGRQKQIIYVHGVRYDLSYAIGGTLTIRAAIRMDPLARLLVVDPTGVFSVVDVDYVNDVIRDTFPVPIPQTVNVGRDETDVKQLYSAFLNPNRLVSVQITATATTVNTYYFDYTESFTWLGPVVEDTLPTITANSTLDFTRTLATSPPPVGSIDKQNIDQILTTTAPGLIVADHTILSGQRVVACNSDISRLALLIETVNTTCDRDVHRPPYGVYSSIWQQFHRITAFGFVVGNAYDWRVEAVGYDSGKLSETWTRTSAPTYSRRVYDFSGNTAISEVAAFSGGSYSSTTEFYDRFANPTIQTSNINFPEPPPVSDMITSFKANEYNENQTSYVRDWTGCIRLYCADPLHDIYVYQKADGNMAQYYLNYSVNVKFQPSTADLEATNNVSGVMQLIFRSGADELILATRELMYEDGVGLQNQHDLNFEPLMAFYTQPQPPGAGATSTINQTDSVSINKSINVCFAGRYCSADPDKAGAAIDLTAGFDYPSLDYPTLSTDRRYILYGDTSIAFQITPAATAWPFFEAWRPHILKDGTTPTSTPVFDPTATLDLELRTFEDRNRRVYSPFARSDTTELEAWNIPPEWPDIRGWIDFRNRPCFAAWTNAKYNVFASGDNISISRSTDSPPLSVMDNLL